MNIKIQKTKYHISLLDRLRIRAIQAKLLMIRIGRGRRFIGKNGLLIFLVLTVIWLLFSGLQMLLAPCFGESEYSFIESFWQIRKEYYSTVILVIAIDACNKAFDNRKKLKRQHLLYYDLIVTADTVFEPFIDDLVHKMMPFYNERMYSETYEYISEKYDKGVYIDVRSFEESFNNLIVILMALIDDIKSGSLVLRNGEQLIDSISETIGEIMTYRDNIVEEGNDPVDLYKHLTAQLYFIIEEIRYIWRKDVSDHERIIRILYRNDRTEVEDDYYQRMFVCSLKEIEEIES